MNNVEDAAPAPAAAGVRAGRDGDDDEVEEVVEGDLSTAGLAADEFEFVLWKEEEEGVLEAIGTTEYLLLLNSTSFS